MLSEFIKQFRRIRQDGSFLFALSRMLNGCIPAHILHVSQFLIVGREPKRTASDPLVVSGVRAATVADLDLLADCGHPQPILNQWFEQGADAWLIEREGKLLSCYWLDGTNRYFLYDWLVIQSTSSDAWVSWWWVSPAHRGEGLAYQVRQLGVSEYARAGYTRIWGVINVLNGNAKGVTDKLACKTAGRLSIFRILGVTIVRFGRTRHIGRWNADSVLELSMADLS